MTDQTETKAKPRKIPTEKDYPPVLFITYSRDDPDDAPVLDVSNTLREARRNVEHGWTYKAHRLTLDPPEYGDEQFVESR